MPSWIDMNPPGEQDPDESGGGSPMSLATEPNTGGVVAGIADRFAAWDARRREQLDAAIRRKPPARGHPDRETEGAVPLEPLPGEHRAEAPPAKAFEPGAPPHDPVNIPVRPAPEKPPASPAKELRMPCGNCGSDAHNRRTCSKPAKGETKAPAEKPPPPSREAKPTNSETKAKPSKPKPTAAGGLRNQVDDLDVEQLVDLRAYIDERLSEREEQLQAQLAAIRAARGSSEAA